MCIFRVIKKYWEGEREWEMHCLLKCHSLICQVVIRATWQVTKIGTRRSNYHLLLGARELFVNKISSHQFSSKRLLALKFFSLKKLRVLLFFLNRISTTTFSLRIFTNADIMLRAYASISRWLPIYLSSFYSPFVGKGVPQCDRRHKHIFLRVNTFWRVLLNKNKNQTPTTEF